MTVAFPGFAEFFRSTIGYMEGTSGAEAPEPHAWQSGLCTKVLSGSWPAALEIPTGLGKTATILVAVYALAWQLHHGVQRTAPQRIFHVVNRRTLVDDTHGFIAKVADAINNSSDPQLVLVRDALNLLLGPGDTESVVTGSIHGDAPENRMWLRATGCSIVTLTPHQFVSRLLMRGFALSERMRPIDAGLVGIDRLVLFDEPHLAGPAVQTILDAERLQAKAAEQIGVPIGCIVQLGATLVDGPDDDRESIDTLGPVPGDPSDPAAPLATRLLNAPKQLRLRRTSSASDATFAKELSQQALAATTDADSVVVFANTVAMAQEVTRLLRAKQGTVDVRLVTSRFRPLDRPAVDPHGITVTTQCLEVGVDISFDALVTEAAPWDALTQRLGRLNRRGTLPRATAVVVTHRGDAVRDGTKNVYGESTVRAAIGLLSSVGADGEEGISVSPSALSELVAKCEPADLVGVSPRAATLHSGLIPLMTHTRPTPVPDLPVTAFVTGPDEKPRNDIEVAWRDSLEALDGARFGDVYSDETVSVPRAALAALLTGRDGGKTVAVSDLPDVGPAVVERAKGVTLGSLRVWDWQREKWKAPGSMREALRAERVVLATTLGGYDRELGWTGDVGSKVTDIHLVAALNALSKPQPGKRRFLLALSQASVESAVGRGVNNLASLDEALADVARAAPDAVLELVHEQGDAIADAVSDCLRALLGKSKGLGIVTDGFFGLESVEGPRGVLCTVVSLGPRWARGTDVVTLNSHLEQVGSWSERDASTAGLLPELVQAIGVAGRWHDAGKAYPAQQSYFAEKERLAHAADADPPLLAKQHPRHAARIGSSQAARRERAAARMPDGFRHEAVSVALYRQRHDEMLTAHLIGSHHGWYRPMMPTVVGAHEDGFEHAEDFAALNARYGPWGLAYLEAVLRLADWRASARPSESETVSTDVKAIGLESIDWGTSLPGPVFSHQLGESEAHTLGGLVTHPLTGWFAAVGLLSAAESSDPASRLHWEDSVNGPPVPVLATRAPLEELVTQVLRKEWWARWNGLVSDRLASKAGLKIKNQKLSPSGQLRGLLLQLDESKEGSRLLGLIADADAADASGKVEMPVVPFANNSSYFAVALGHVLRRDSVEDCLASLVDVDRGYSMTACDGGMDQARGMALVNGLGSQGDERMVRTAIAPLAVFGMGALGSTGAGPLGVVPGNPASLLLPMPDTPVSLEELRSMTIQARNPTAQKSMGSSWQYSASRARFGPNEQVGIVWEGGIRRQSK